MFVTHARTLEELRAEVLSDLNRRIEFLMGQSRTIARSKAEQSRNSAAILALEDMLNFWKELTIVASKTKK